MARGGHARVGTRARSRARARIGVRVRVSTYLPCECGVRGARGVHFVERLVAVAPAGVSRGQQGSAGVSRGQQGSAGVSRGQQGSAGVSRGQQGLHRGSKVRYPAVLRVSVRVGVSYS
jgi:hypothetical protein